GRNPCRQFGGIEQPPADDRLTTLRRVAMAKGFSGENLSSDPNPLTRSERPMGGQIGSRHRLGWTRRPRRSVGGSMNASMTATADSREALDRLLGELRPKLHRYCARMTGSVIDGEDVAQEALAKAIEAFPEVGTIVRPESWLFRIAHNAALDFLRRRTREVAARSNEDPDMIIDPAGVDPQIAAASPRTFMRLPVTQRSCVILMHVLAPSLH